MTMMPGVLLLNCIVSKDRRLFERPLKYKPAIVTPPLQLVYYGSHPGPPYHCISN